MHDHYTFVQEIRANPRDDVPRLIYADFLEESGDPRGDLIRVQVELAHLAMGEPGRSSLECQEQRLLERHAEDWLRPLRELGVEGVSVRCFQRGLIERAKVQGATFAKHGEELCRLEPALHVLELRNPQESADALVHMRLPPQVRHLDLSSNRMTSDDLSAIRSAGWWTQISELNLQFNALADQGIAVLTSLAVHPLRRLWLGINRVGPDGARLLANWPQAGQLTGLFLNVNRLGDAGAAQLVRSEYLRSVEELDLASNGIGDAGGVALANSSDLSRLRKLNVRGNLLDLATWQALATAARWRELTTLDIRGNKNTSAEVLAILDGVVVR